MKRQKETVVVMDPRTHRRGAPPDFALPRPNPNPSRVTDALWWLVCMRLALEPALSRNGGTFANKSGSHNAGENLRDHGVNDPRTDHSIRDRINRAGPWWEQYCAAHDWTFVDAQRGDYRTINRYTGRLIRAMRDPQDPRPSMVYHYTLGQADGDPVVEGWHVLRREVLSSSDLTHLWHRHDSFLRSAVGDFWAMWAALTIDMGWTVAEWRSSLPGGGDDMTPDDLLKTEIRSHATGVTANVRDLLKQGLEIKMIGLPAVQRDVAELRYAVGGLADALRAVLDSGGSIDTAAVLQRIDQRASEDAGRDAAHAQALASLADRAERAEQEAAELRQRLAAVLQG